MKGGGGIRSLIARSIRAKHIQLPGLWSLGLGAWGSCEVECAKEAIPKFIGLPNPATCPFRQFTSPDERALPVNLRGNGSTATTSGAPASSSDRVSWHSRITLIRPSRDCKNPHKGPQTTSQRDLVTCNTISHAVTCLQIFVLFIEPKPYTLPYPGITYLFKDVYKEIIIRSPKKVGSSGLR